jgi:hypothetical protein
MTPHEIKPQKSSLYDPELPDANAVMASLLCVATIYAGKPSLELAKLALSLAQKLTAPEYAESELICSVSRRISMQWGFVVRDYEQTQSALIPVQAGMH